MPPVRNVVVVDDERPILSEVRDEAVRTRARGMSRRKGSRGAVSARVARVANDVAGRLRDIRVLWYAVHNNPHLSVEEQAAEYYFAVGEILGGRPLKSLTFQKIDRERVIAHAEE